MQRPTPTRHDHNKKITDYVRRETRTTRRKENLNRIPGSMAEWANDVLKTSENKEEGYEATMDGEEKEDSELTLQHMGLIFARNRIMASTLVDILNSLATANMEDKKGRARLQTVLCLLAKLLVSILAGKAQPSERSELEDNIISKLKAMIKDMVNVAMSRISKEMEEAMKVIKSVNTATMALTTKTKFYSKAVWTNPALLDVPFALNMAINPRARARKAIRKRQVLIDIDQTEENRELIKNTSITGFTEEFNSRLKKIGEYNGYEVKALTKLANGGLLLEMLSEEGAKWVKSRKKEIEEVVRVGARVKKCTSLVIIKFVPITLDPELEEERATMKDVNDLTRGTLSLLRWIKPITERLEGQRVGHLIARFENEEDANKVTAMGLYIHHVWVIAEKQNFDMAMLLPRKINTLKAQRTGN
ncbi:hypothetical protein E4T56_gene12781 [Termitomyces sp. T112]|nr:hypothetical protein E4T56_gene12781 [Termitomyces sp. T112]